MYIMNLLYTLYCLQMTGNTFIKSIVVKYDQEPNIIGNYTKEEKPQKKRVWK